MGMNYTCFAVLLFWKEELIGSSSVSQVGCPWGSAGSCRMLLYFVICLFLWISSLPAAAGVGREVSGSSSVGVSGCREMQALTPCSGRASIRSRQMELPIGDMGMDELSCCSLLASAKGCGQVSGVVCMAQSMSR